MVLVLGAFNVSVAQVGQSSSVQTISVSDTVDVQLIQPKIKARSLVSIFNRLPENSMYYIRLNEEREEVVWDSLGNYTISQELFGFDVFLPQKVNFEEFTALKKAQQIENNFNALVTEIRTEEQEKRGLLDFKINIPSGKNSAFTTIFGKPEVNLRVNGTANLNVGANIQKIDDPSIPPDQQTRVDPTFDQNLKLNIQGTIGDKLTISTDWDTERNLDFQNRLNIVYQGYEDEIIKTVELGNVSMETGNSLIRGGGALFGIKSVAELGNLRLTTVVSQQQGQGNSQTISGGSQELPILLRPASYDHNRHYFLDFYNRQEFENLMSNPQQIGQAYQIAEFELYLRRGDNSQPDQNAIRAVSLVDLGVNDLGNGNYGLPNNDFDRFLDSDFAPYRDPAVSISSENLGVQDQEFDAGLYERLIEGVDYTLNRGPGYISMKRVLNPNDVLAVAYTYASGTQNIQVGELANVGDERIFLKMLRLNNARSNNPTFPLEMRNIYSLGVTGVTQDGLSLTVEFVEGNIAQERLPGRSQTLLQDLGLDRVNVERALIPDNQIDFIGSILNAADGRVIFPYLEPFGSRLDEILTDAGIEDAERERIVYSELYDPNLSQAQAETRSENNFYRLSGVSKGGVSGSYLLGFGLVEGSVRVTANGSQLVEDVDFEVDYSFGQLTILNDRYLAAGQEINIEYESNQLTVIGQKNFTGVRAEYSLSDNVQIGSTFFRLKEQPLSDKIRIGSEPINNTVLGLDASGNFDTPWLTRAIDKVPLLQTKEPSRITFSGEFAQLRPGVAQTNAVEDAIRRGDLFKDEEQGLVFIDDFEGAEVNISFLSPSRWSLASAPAAVPGIDVNYFMQNDFDPALPDQSLNARTLRSDFRSQFSWYSIPRTISGVSLSDVPDEARLISVQEVFPGRETNNPNDQILTTLDVFYNPESRGQYNYNTDIKNLTENEADRLWGGMTAVVPFGQEDLTQNNVEFLEFWVQSLLPDGRDPTAQDLLDYEGKIYLDLGIVSEDIVPNSRLNSEDGLATDLNDLIPDRATDNARSYTPSNPPPPLNQFSNANRDLEDVGLDGMPNTNGYEGAGGRIDEQTVFAEYIDSMRSVYGEGSEEFERILADPSNDDYFFFTESILGNLPLQERFYRLFGFHEGNTPVAGGEKRAITNQPDSEGLRTSSILEQSDQYYQYEVDFNPADIPNLVIGAPNSFIVDQIGSGTDVQRNRWYQIRIPLNDFKRRIGGITDFQNIRYIRLWMSGYKKPFTMRFASFEFVGSQWRKDDQLSESQGSSASFEISTINIEENGSRKPFPYRQPIGAIRAENRGSQLQALANEQSIVLDVENLGPGEIQLIERIYPGGLNLLNYSNMRMFIHGEGFDQRGDAELVMRFGIDLENNYYEYRQPVTPSDLNFIFKSFNQANNADLEAEAEQIWLYDQNSMNIVLSAFNQLKQIRGSLDAPENKRFERSDLLTDAPPGAVVVIKGNPSLDRVSEIGMGIRNPYDPSNPGLGGVPNLNAQFWLNELRVSGFDDLKGWAANAKASAKLADFATINANLTRQTNGFGGLESRLGQRRQSEQLGLDLNSTVNLHKLVPDRYGWNFPVSLSARQSTTTPRFLPNQGDIRLTDFEQATNARDDITDTEKKTIIDETIRSSQTHNESYSVNFSNISKRNSQSKIAQYTIDKTTINYNYSEGNSRSPELLFQENWNFNSSVRYNLTFRNVKLVRPFNFTRNIPVAKALAGLQMGVMPSSITTSASLNRSYDEKRRRSRENSDGLLIEQGLQQTHIFNHGTTFGFNYNLTQSIPMSFQTSTGYDLSTAGIQSRNQTGIDSTAFKVVPTFDVVKSVISDSLKARRINYRESYTTSWRPRFNRINALNWTSYNASYSGGYQWVNSPRGSDLGANVSNNFRLDHTLKLEINKLLERTAFLKNLKSADRTASQERSREKTRRKTAQENDTEYEAPPPDLFKDAGFIGRKLVLAAFSLRAVDISYRTNKTSSQAGYSGRSQFFKSFNSPNTGDFSPSFGYRIGIFDQVSKDQLISNPNPNSSLQLPGNKTTTDNLTLGTSFNPFPNFTIDLDWTARWDERRSENITLESSNEVNAVVSRSGNVNSSVWVFGPGYRDLFERQLRTAFGDIDENNNVSDATGNQDGRTVLNRNVVADDFRLAYLGSGSETVGNRAFQAFPKPNWRVTWAGIEKFFPIIGPMMQRASLTHSYSGSHRLGYSFNNNSGPQPARTIGGYSVTDVRSEYEPTSVNVEQRFVPMVQLNITWKSSLRTNIGFDQTRTTSLAVASSTITERTSRGIKVTVAYTLRNIRLPILNRVKNNIDISLNGGLAEDEEIRFLLNDDVNDALALFSDTGSQNFSDFVVNPRPPTGQQRINASMVIGYRFSNTINANFEYSFNKVNPKSSRTFARTDHDIKFNIRIAIRSS